jgi:hypothetical protein
MIQIAIKIRTQEDAFNHTEIIEGVPNDDLIEAGHLTVCIQEKGTRSGQLGVTFIVKGNDGKHYEARCSGSQFEQLFGAYTGAQQRFGVIPRT